MKKIIERLYVNNKKLVLSVTSLLLLVIVFYIGLCVGFNKKSDVEKLVFLKNSENATITDSVDFAPFWKAWNILNDKFVSSKKGEGANNQEKVWGAIKGLTSSFGDPYTVFLPPRELQVFESDIQGSFEGVGMELGIRDGALTVVSPLKGTPAYEAGVKSGDKIMKINDKDSINITVEDALSLIRGKKGTEVKIVILRPGEKVTREFKIIRDVINIPTIDTELRSDGIFVIKLYSFTANSPELFRKALREFVSSHADKLILDLRGDPGGYLEAAVDIASWFLPSGKIIVKEDFGDKNKDAEIFRSKGYNIFNDNLKFVILVDGGSASASEILAGALKEHGVAKLVGEKTFGKGSVQELINLTKDASIKVTVARWFTPNGLSISDNGLTPDYEVKADTSDKLPKKDLALEKAVELLLNYKK